ncbi:hypothetical protein V8C42DRAFT_189696 [Trichoderma barbatum]
MLLTLRFAAALQDDDGDLDDGTKSDSVDIDEGNSASEGTDLGRLSHIASEEDVTMKDGQDGNDAKTTEGDMDVDEGIDIDILEDNIPIPDTDLDLEFVPRQYDGLVAKNDEFLNKVIKSGAYQSWRIEPPKEFEVVLTPPPPGSDVIQVDAERLYRDYVLPDRIASPPGSDIVQVDADWNDRDYVLSERIASPPGSDIVQVDADWHDNESFIARKIASDEILFRKNSLDESVVDKWQRQQADEVVTVVTPPNMEAYEEYRSPFDHPNADVEFDNEIYPDDIHRFRAAQEAADEPMLKSRDQSCERDRPVLNLVHPTPSASPSPESKPDEERQSMEASGDTDDGDFPLDDVAIGLEEARAMLSYLGENSDEPAEAEEDFSPHLKRVGHVDFDKIANPHAERPPGPPPATMRVSSRTIATVVDDDVEYFDIGDVSGRVIGRGDERGSHKQKERDEDEAQRHERRPHTIPRDRVYNADANADVNAKNLADSVRLPSFTEELLKDKAREQQQRAEEEMQRRGLALEQQRAEEQVQRWGLAERMLSRRHSTTGLESRRHGVVFDRWVERELDDDPPE